MPLREIIVSAAPRTWVMSVVPVLVTGALVFRERRALNLVFFCLLLLLCALLQGGWNLLKARGDARRGKDTLDGAGIPLLFRLPLGEIVCGFLTGCVIPVIAYLALTGVFDPSFWWNTLPVAFGAGLIVMTRNVCAMEEDREARRYTFPVLLGRKRAMIWYKFSIFVWIAMTLSYMLVLQPLPMRFTTGFYLVGGPAILCLLFCLVMFFRQAGDIYEKEKRPVLMKRISLMHLLSGIAIALSCLIPPQA